MAKKRSFTEIMGAEGIADFNKLAPEALERMIKQGKIQSAYSHVTTMDEFYGVRAGAFEIDVWEEFVENLYAKKIFSLQQDSLGELLQTANFFTIKENIAFNLGAGWENEEEYDEVMGYLRNQFKITPETQQPFLAQGISSVNLINFVNEWHKAQGDTKRWNPNYANPLPQEEIYHAIVGNNCEEWIKKLMPPYEFEFKDPHVIGGVAYYNFEPFEGNNVFLPFDGWTLAECFRRQYESKKE